MTCAPDRLLVDAETGLITRLDHRELRSGGRPLHLWSCLLADGRFSVGASHDRVSAGCDFDRERARLAAIGEAVERYCGNIPPRGLRLGSHRALRAEGLRALAPEAIELYAPSQYAAAGFPFRPLTAALEIDWVPGEALGAEAGPVLLPASLVLLNLKDLRGGGRPWTNFVMLAGIACGPDIEAASLSGLLEVIERDATTIWWMGVDEPRAVDPALWPAAIEAFGEDAFKSGALRLFDLTTEFEVPVIGALLAEERIGVALMGFAARLDPLAAARKAYAEAAQLLTMAAAFLDPGSPIWRSAEAGFLHPSALVPFRADRRYAAGFRADFRDMTDLLHHTLYYLDPAAQAALAPFRQGPAATPPPRPFPGGGLDGVARGLEGFGCTVYRSNLTSADIADTGLSVVRMLAPGLAPNAPAAFPYLGPARLYRVPAERGWARGRLLPEDLRYAPLPHS